MRIAGGVGGFDGDKDSFVLSFECFKDVGDGFSGPDIGEWSFVELVSARGVEEFVEHGDDAACALCVGGDGSGVFVGDKDLFDAYHVEVCGVVAVEEFDASEDGGGLFFDEHGGEDGASVAVLVGSFTDLIGEDDGFVGASDAGAFEDFESCKVAFDDVECGG